MNIDQFYAEDNVLDRDLHKAVEAQGRVAISAIDSLIAVGMPEEGRAEIAGWLDVLSNVLAYQGHPTRDCTNVALYSDGSPVFRLVRDGQEASDGRDYLDDSDHEFPYIGDLAEFLALSNTDCRIKVNDPPIQSPGKPGLLLSTVRDRMR